MFTSLSNLDSYLMFLDLMHNILRQDTLGVVDGTGTV